MQYRGRNRLISDLHLRIYNELINELSKNSDWKKVADYLVQSHEWSRRKWIDDFERKGDSRRPPANWLLDKLKSMNYSVDELCQILRNCDLLYAVYAIVGIEKSKITEQPNKQEAEVDAEILMKCTANGVPPPQYQWYHGNVELPGETSSTLRLRITGPEQEGEYLCRISQYDSDGNLLHDAYSNCAPLVVKPTPVEIIKQSQSCEVPLGKSLRLFCEARSHPSPRYQWYKDDKKLPHKDSNVLKKKKFKQKHTGKYHCCVWNGSDEKWTEGINVEVEDELKTATAKIALLIANSDYRHLTNLPLAERDAASLAEKLEAMKFKVIRKHNLTLTEMKTAVELFCKELPEDSYGLFYFVGHGCMIDDYHMLPVDASLDENSYEECSFPQQYFLDAAQEQKPALLVGILDMCLTKLMEVRDQNREAQLKTILKSKCHNSLVLAYATCSYCPSYEEPGKKNGVYMSQLLHHISKKKPASKLFPEIATAVQRSQKSKTNNQKPMFTIIQGEPNLCLTDEIVCPGKIDNPNQTQRNAP